MSIYRWGGPERPLGTPLITAASMSVDVLEDDGAKLTASGGFVFHDHMEGSTGDDRWEAVGTRTGDSTGDSVRWVVKRKSDGFSLFNEANGDPAFTLLGQVNDAIKRFISDKLTGLAEFRRKHPGMDVAEFVDEPRRFVGTHEIYEGPCICDLLRSSEVAYPFNRDYHLGSGNFPKNCFKCSCGKLWFRGNPEKELWVQVGDAKAWEMLMEFDGVAVQPVTLHPRAEVPTLMLLSTVRQEGFIPLG